MKLGTCHLWGDSTEEFINEVRLADELGFGVVGIGDSPAGWHNMEVAMTLAAQNTRNAIIAPLVTSPFLRHPLMAAGALASLQQLTDGRIACGLATGGSTVLAIGRPPANQTEIRDYWFAMRDLWAGKGIEWEGRPVKPLRFARPVPVYYSAFGPKALALAGEQADGVILFASRNLSELDEKIEAVHRAARAAGRNPKDIDLWVISFCSVRDTPEQAVEDLKAFIVVNGMAIRTPEAMARVPGQFRDKLVQLHQRYDATEHVVVGGKNVRLMDELGLTEFLKDFDTIYGTPDQVKATLDGIAARGVSTFIAALPGHGDREGTIRRLAALQG